MIEAVVHAELGILALGLFVGALLALGLSKSGGTLKAVITAIGAALGGGPILFIQGVGDAKWSYPVGLVLGLLWPRLLTARLDIARGVRRGGRENRVHALFAWIDLIIIGVAAGGAAVYGSL